MHTWFLEIDFVLVCVCVSTPEELLLTSGVIWTQYDWLNNFYSFYMAAVVGIISIGTLALMHIIETNVSKVS